MNEIPLAAVCLCTQEQTDPSNVSHQDETCVIGSEMYRNVDLELNLDPFQRLRRL